jgi:hypothetical protein
MADHLGLVLSKLWNCCWCIRETLLVKAWVKLGSEILIGPKRVLRYALAEAELV